MFCFFVANLLKSAHKLRWSFGKIHQWLADLFFVFLSTSLNGKASTRCPNARGICLKRVSGGIEPLSRTLESFATACTGSFLFEFALILAGTFTVDEWACKLQRLCEIDWCKNFTPCDCVKLFGTMRRRSFTLNLIQTLYWFLIWVENQYNHPDAWYTASLIFGGRPIAFGSVLIFNINSKG